MMPLYFPFARLRPVAVVVGLVAWLVSSLPATCAEQLPCYEFQAGQELSYRLVVPGNERDDGKGGKIPGYSTTVRWKIYVVRKNANGTWTMLFTNRWSNEAPGSSEMYSDGYFDLAPDGRLTNVETLQPGITDITVLFPPLPPNSGLLAGGWQSTSPVDGAVCKLKFLDKDNSPSAAECRIGAEIDGLFNSVYEITERREYLFSREQGLVRSGTVTKDQQSTPWQPHLTMPIELVGMRQLDSDQTADLDDEVARYVAADKQCRKLIKGLQYHDFRDAEAVLDEAESVLKQLSLRLKLPLVKAMAEEKLNSHKRYREDYLQDASYLARMVDTPAPDWRTTDLDENPHTMTDYRGKVVVLDFWFRGCRWCTRCMPQIKQLVEDFQGHNVVFLGMNSDDNEHDARYVIEKARLNFPTLKDEGQRIRKAFRGPATYPTMIIVDSQGVVRHVHIGYSPSLRQEIGDVIRSLLAKTAE